LEFAFQMHLVVAQWLQLAQGWRFAERLLPEQRAVGQLLLASLEPPQDVALHWTAGGPL